MTRVDFKSSTQETDTLYLFCRFQLFTDMFSVFIIRKLFDKAKAEIKREKKMNHQVHQRQMDKAFF